MSIIVQKYGGTSVATTDLIRNVARRLVKIKEQGHQVACVVSAMGKETDKLVALAKEISQNPRDREMDMLLSTGEQVSIALLCMALHELGCDAISLTGAQAGIITSSHHGKAAIHAIDADKIKGYLNEGKIVVIAGFQGISLESEIFTLGRGGSDTSAVAVAAGLKADVCEILTDVDGVYTSDPRVVKNARKLDKISYQEMLELAYLGAGVLHPRSVELAKQYGLPLHVRSSFSEVEGTLLVEGETMENKRNVSGVAIDKNAAKITLMAVPDRPGIAATVFGALADRAINVDVIIQNVNRGDVNDISFTVTEDDLFKAMKIVEELSGEIKPSEILTDKEVAKVSIVGAGMVSHPGVAAKMFRTLGEKKINIQMITTSEIKVTCVIAKDKAEEAAKALHDAFFPEGE